MTTIEHALKDHRFELKRHSGASGNPGATNRAVRYTCCCDAEGRLTAIISAGTCAAPIMAALSTGSGAFKAGFLPYGENPTSTGGGTFRYTGRRIDPETAGSTTEPSGLYYYRTRHYSPTLGRFLQPDLIGYAGGNNL